MCFYVFALHTIIRNHEIHIGMLENKKKKKYEEKHVEFFSILEFNVFDLYATHSFLNP